MNNTEKFIDEIIKDRKRQLAGLSLDLGYFEDRLRVLYDEDVLRDKLKIEKEKEPLERDSVEIGKLEKDIDFITETKKKIAQYETAYTEITRYLEYIQENTEKISKLVEDYL